MRNLRKRCINFEGEFSLLSQCPVFNDAVKVLSLYALAFKMAKPVKT
jgi:hypothetical protein